MSARLTASKAVLDAAAARLLAEAAEKPEPAPAKEKAA
jgi:hypothetical protein